MARQRINYAEKLKDPRWQRLRLEVFQRDNFTCQCCGANDKTLHAHHLHYRQDAEGPWDYLPASILTLCECCHTEEHESMAYRNALLIEGAAIAGFRTCEEVGVLHDMLVTLGRAIEQDDAVQLFFQMASDHIQQVRERKRHGSAG